MGLSISSFFSFVKGKPINIVMLGLEDAGKTTILSTMNLGEVIHKIPSIAFHTETIDTRNLALTCWDIYPNRIRALWNPFFE
jgi:GTPase SAR1 family protein